jgi:hypothetical protein
MREPPRAFLLGFEGCAIATPAVAWVVAYWLRRALLDAPRQFSAEIWDFADALDLAAKVHEARREGAAVASVAQAVAHATVSGVSSSMMGRELTTKEYASAVGVTPGAIAKRCRSGTLPARQKHGEWLIREENLWAELGMDGPQ